MVSQSMDARLSPISNQLIQPLPFHIIYTILKYFMLAVSSCLCPRISFALNLIIYYEWKVDTCININTIRYNDVYSIPLPRMSERSYIINHVKFITIFQ